MDSIEEIRSRMNAATPGKWSWSPEGLGEFDDPSSLLAEDSLVIRLEDCYIGYSECGQDLRMDVSKVDRDFITHSKEDIALLLRRVEELTEKKNGVCGRWRLSSVESPPTDGTAILGDFGIHGLQVCRYKKIRMWDENDQNYAWYFMDFYKFETPDRWAQILGEDE